MDTKRDPILRELVALKKAELLKMAAEFVPPVELKKSYNSRQIACAIRKRQKQVEAAADKQQSEPAVQQPGENTEFEAAAGGSIPLSDEPPQENRGGARPGAGRPQGSTVEKVAVKKALGITQPNETIVQLVKMFFALWAARMNIPELAVTDEEACDMALPITQLLEYYLPGQIPEIAWAWLSLAGTGFIIVQARIELIKNRRNNSVQQENDKPNDTSQG